VALPDPPGARVLRVATAAEMADACEREFDACEVLLMAAAVADFRPANPADIKLKKDRGVPALVFEPTVDVLSVLSANRRPAQVLVGFAAEHGPDAVSLAREKLSRKGLDLVVVNDISRTDIGFDVPENEVTIVSATGECRVPRADKANVARAVLDQIELANQYSRENVNGAGAGAGRAATV
jgi:phosphopantothenoylcysteine decarboxylase / phosphopantothenate---cysteine ligase